MFAKEEMKENISNLKKFDVKTGFANIGGVAIRF